MATVFRPPLITPAAQSPRYVADVGVNLMLTTLAVVVAAPIPFTPPAEPTTRAPTSRAVVDAVPNLSLGTLHPATPFVSPAEPSPRSPQRYAPDVPPNLTALSAPAAPFISPDLSVTQRPRQYAPDYMPNLVLAELLLKPPTPSADPPTTQRVVRYASDIVPNPLPLAAAVPGATYYIATTGSDSTGDGSQGNPWATFARGVSALRPSDTLLARGGTYVEALGDGTPGGTSWGAPVLIAAYPGEAVTLRPASGQGVVVFSSAGRQFIELRGLVLDAVNCTADAVKVTYTTSSSYAHHIRLRSCEVMNAPVGGNGVLITNGGGSGGAGRLAAVDGNEVLACHVHHNGATNNLRHGIYCESSGNLFDGNECDHNGGFGIQQYKSYGAGNQLVGLEITGNVVTRNRCHDNNQSGTGQGGMIVAGTGTLCADNVCYNNVGAGGPDGIKVAASDCSSSGTKVYNNTVYGQTTGNGINLRATADGTLVRNNVCFGNGTQYNNSGTNTVQDHNLNVPTGATDPLFVNAAAADFRLRAGSPAIDAGTTLPEVGADALGVIRPQGSAYDLGAYEYPGAPFTPPSADPVTTQRPTRYPTDSVPNLSTSALRALNPFVQSDTWAVTWQTQRYAVDAVSDLLVGTLSVTPQAPIVPTDLTTAQVRAQWFVGDQYGSPNVGPLAPPPAAAPFKPPDLPQSPRTALRVAPDAPPNLLAAPTPVGAAVPAIPAGLPAGVRGDAARFDAEVAPNITGALLPPFAPPPLPGLVADRQRFVVPPTPNLLAGALNPAPTPAPFATPEFPEPARLRRFIAQTAPNLLVAIVRTAQPAPFIPAQEFEPEPPRRVVLGPQQPNLCLVQPTVAAPLPAIYLSGAVQRTAGVAGCVQGTAGVAGSVQRDVRVTGSAGAGP